MPRAKKSKKPTQVLAPTPEPTPEPMPEPELPGLTSQPVNPEGLEVVYPSFVIVERSTTSKHGPLTVQDCKDLLNWETESEFLKRMSAQHPGTDPARFMALPSKKDVFGEEYHCKNVANEKVRCGSNANNREFDDAWCQKLVQTILNGQWAGPATLPSETVNGETIRISRYGRVLSGQHQMTALILADEKLEAMRNDPEIGVAATDELCPMWALSNPNGWNHPFLEVILVKGVSEHPLVIQSVDYTKPRSAADMFYTSGAFRDATSAERKELCRLLASATNFLWDRTNARGYKTHIELHAFLERHKRLLKCVLHLYDTNKASTGRKISKLKLSAGHCAALMYLMASSGPDTDAGVYRNEEPAPSEKNLDFSMWDRAADFWTLLAQGLDFEPLRSAIRGLLTTKKDDDDNPGLGGRASEKLALLSNGWQRWKECGSEPPFPPGRGTADLLTLSYTDVDENGNPLPKGEIHLIDDNNFGGIDAEHKDKPGDPPEPMEISRDEANQAIEEASRRKEEVARRRQAGE